MKKLTQSDLAKIVGISPPIDIDAIVEKSISRIIRRNAIPLSDSRHAPLSSLVIDQKLPSKWKRLVSIAPANDIGQRSSLPDRAVGLITGNAPFKLVFCLYQSSTGYRGTHRFEILPYRDGDTPRTIIIDYPRPLYTAYYNGHSANDLDNGKLNEWILTRLYPRLKEQLCAI